MLVDLVLNSEHTLVAYHQKNSRYVNLASISNTALLIYTPEIPKTLGGENPSGESKIVV